MRAAEHLHPGLLNYPINKDGETSKKLEDISPANGFNEHQAHDAMGDVMATVHLAKIIKESSPTYGKVLHRPHQEAHLMVVWTKTTHWLFMTRMDAGQSYIQG